MNEIDLYYDRGKKDKIDDTITFEPILAGKTTTKKIYIENNIDYKIKMTIEMEQDDVKLKKYPQEIQPNSMEPIKLEYSPKITEKKPIEAEFSIEIDYVVTQ